MLKPRQTKPVLLGGPLLSGPKQYREHSQDTAFPLKKKKKEEVGTLFLLLLSITYQLSFHMYPESHSLKFRTVAVIFLPLLTLV